MCQSLDGVRQSVLDKVKGGEARETTMTPAGLLPPNNGREGTRQGMAQRVGPPAEGQAIGTDLLRARWRWPVGMPLCRPMGHGLGKIRTDMPSRCRAHELLCLHPGRLVVPLGLVKKTPTAPHSDLATAWKRQTAFGR